MNFDPDRFPVYIKKAIDYREAIRELLKEASVKNKQPFDEELNHGPAVWKPENDNYDLDYLVSEGKGSEIFTLLW